MIGERRTFGLYYMDVGRGTDAVLVDSGYPFYFSWSTFANDPRILGYAGRERLDLINVEAQPGGHAHARVYTFDQSSETFVGLQSKFSTPLWLSNNQAIFAVGAGNEMYVVQVSLGEPRYESVIAKCHTRSPLRFIASPNEQLLAYAPTEGGFFLCEIGRDKHGVHKIVSTEAVTAFCWSPDSRYLLWCYLDIAMRCFFWAVYDVERDVKYRLSSFVPSQDVMQNYFPFFLSVCSQHDRVFTR